MHKLNIDLISQSDLWMCLGGIMALGKVLLFAIPAVSLYLGITHRKNIPFLQLFRPWQWAVGLVAVAIPMAIRFGLPEDNFFQYWDVMWLVSAPLQSLGPTAGAKDYGPMTITAAWVLDAFAFFLLIWAVKSQPSRE